MILILLNQNDTKSKDHDATGTLKKIYFKTSSKMLQNGGKIIQIGSGSSENGS